MARRIDLSKVDFNSGKLFDDNIHESMYVFPDRNQQPFQINHGRPLKEYRTTAIGRGLQIKTRIKHQNFAA